MGIQICNQQTFFYLDSQKTYSASVKALNGDYSETTFGNSINSNTTAQAVALDLDIGPSSNPNIESSQPYNINIMSGTGYQTVQNFDRFIMVQL